MATRLTLAGRLAAVFCVLAVQVVPCGAFSPAGLALRVPRGMGAARRPQAQRDAPRMTGASGVGEDLAPIVVVAGATGRVGRLVVDQLLNPPLNSTQAPVRVRALVRDLKKAESALPQDPALEVVRCDLLAPAQLQAACSDAAAAVWCATGFSDSQDSSIVSKLMGAFKLKFTPTQSVDIAAMRAMGACFKDRPSPLGGPRYVCMHDSLTEALVSLSLSVSLSLCCDACGTSHTHPKSHTHTHTHTHTPSPFHLCLKTPLMGRTQIALHTHTHTHSVIMCSSAGVTRPTWAEDKKQRLASAR